MYNNLELFKYQKKAVPLLENNQFVKYSCSSSWGEGKDVNFTANCCVFNTNICYHPEKAKYSDQWLLLEFTDSPKLVMGFKCRGRNEHQQFTKELELLYSSDGITWKSSGRFKSNSDQGSIVTRYLSEPIIASEIKFLFHDFNKVPAFKVELLGFDQLDF